MIVCKLIGGLGNQMFCYSMGRALSLEKKIDLVIDKTWIEDFFHKTGDNIFGLDCFSSSRDFKYRSATDSFTKYDFQYSSRILRWVDTLIPFKYKKIFLEKKFGYDNRYFNTKRREVYLKSGYWQSYKYFEKYEREIRSDFTFSNNVYEEVKDEANMILSDENSVAVHIRRGDYTSNSSTVKVHGGVCDLEYYTKAINMMKERNDKSNFYFFSDDIEWVKETFKFLPNSFYIGAMTSKVENEKGHKDKGYTDMYLMSICKNNIIANSSFSWWAAWLNKNEDKCVISPHKWFNIEADTSNLIPEDWIKI